MKAKELIQHLHALMGAEGEDVEVFMSASGYYCGNEQEELQPPEKYTPYDSPAFWSIGHSHQSY